MINHLDIIEINITSYEVRALEVRLEALQAELAVKDRRGTYVYIYIYMYTYMYIRMYVYIYIYIYTYLYSSPSL